MVTLQEASREDTPVLRQLLNLHLHDLSEFEPADLGADGRFAYPYLDLYWTEVGRHAFLVRVESALAGFALVNTHVYLEGSERSLAELFIARRYRGRGVGRHVVRDVLGRSPGVWEIRVQERNRPARAFWRAVLEESEPQRHPEWDGVIYQVRSG
ncbi:MAG: GNAT family N-acetyltransferase [Bacteroidota bacterium]